MFSFSVLIIFILSRVDGNIRNKTSTITVSNNVHELPYLTPKHYIQIMDILLEERRLRRLLEQDVKELQHKVNLLNFKPKECSQNLECIDRVQIQNKELRNKNSDTAMLQDQNSDSAIQQSNNSDTAIIHTRNSDTAIVHIRNSDTAILQNKNGDNAILQNKNGDTAMSQDKSGDTAMLQNKNSITAMLQNGNSDTAMSQNGNSDNAMSQNGNSDTAMSQNEVTEHQQNATFKTEWNNTISRQQVDLLTNTNKNRTKRNTFQSILRDLSIIKTSTEATNQNYLILYQMTSSLKRKMDMMSKDLENIRNGEYTYWLYFDLAININVLSSAYDAFLE